MNVHSVFQFTFVEVLNLADGVHVGGLERIMGV